MKFWPWTTNFQPGPNFKTMRRRLPNVWQKKFLNWISYILIIVLWRSDDFPWSYKLLSFCAVWLPVTLTLGQGHPISIGLDSKFIPSTYVNFMAISWESRPVERAKAYYICTVVCVLLNRSKYNTSCLTGQTLRKRFVMLHFFRVLDLKWT